MHESTIAYLPTIRVYPRVLVRKSHPAILIVYATARLSTLSGSTERFSLVGRQAQASICDHFHASFLIGRYAIAIYRVCNIILFVFSPIVLRMDYLYKHHVGGKKYIIKLIIASELLARSLSR